MTRLDITTLDVEGVKLIGILMMVLVGVAGMAMVTVANDVGSLGPSIDTEQVANGTNDTIVEPGGSVYIDVAFNTTSDSDSSYDGPGLNVTLPDTWDINPVENGGGTFKQVDNNIGEWVWLSNNNRQNVTYEIDVPNVASGDYSVGATGSAINNTGSNNQETSADTLIITVNEPPTADFTATPDPANTGESITFDASASNDPDGAIQSYNWSFGNGDIANNTGTTTTKSYADNGTYDVTLTVTGDEGLTNSTTKQVTINNRPPNVDINTNKTAPVTVEVGDTIQFDNGTSSDSDGSIVSNDWEFGDGTTASGTPVTHSYSSSGTYQVNLTATDDDGATNTTNITVTVQEAPTADFTADDPKLTGESVNFDASASSDPDGTISAYNWSFGNGDIANNTGTTTTKSYADNGTYDVTLTVTDDSGLSNSTTKQVTINNRPPNVDINTNKTAPVTVEVGDTIQFDNGTSSDPDGSIVGNAWQFGDGTTTSGTPVTHSYSSPGTYQVNLTVADDDGATNTTNITVQVQQPPVPDFSVSQSSAGPTVNESLSFDASATTDDGTIQSYNWSFGDATTANETGTTTNKTYSNNPTYDVTLTVTDNDGLTNTTTKQVDVRQCRQVAIANYDTADQQINLFEIQFGISWYQTNSVVANSGEVMGTTTPPYPSTNALTEIQNRITEWQNSASVSC